MPNKRKLVTHDADGKPLRWRDLKGVLHAVEFALPHEGGVEVWWTRCGAWNIGRGEATGSRHEPTCPSCRAIERGG